MCDNSRRLYSTLVILIVFCAIAGCSFKGDDTAQNSQSNLSPQTSVVTSQMQSGDGANTEGDAGLTETDALEQFLTDPVSTALTFKDADAHKAYGFVSELLAGASEDEIEAVGRILFEEYGDMYNASYQFTQQLNSEYLKLFDDAPHLEINRIALPFDEKTAEGIKEALSDVSRRLPQAGMSPSPEEYPDFSDTGIVIKLPGEEDARIRMDESGRLLLWVSNILSAAGLNSQGSSYVDCPELLAAVLGQVEDYTGWKYTPLSQISGFESVLLYEGESPVASADPEAAQELLSRAKPLGFAPNWHGEGARLYISCKDGSSWEMEIDARDEETFMLWLFPCFFYRFENTEDIAAFGELFGLKEFP